MPDVNITYDRRRHAIDVSFKSERNISYERLRINFAGKELNRADRLITRMESTSAKCAKLRRRTQFAKSAQSNRKALDMVYNYGCHLFDTIRRECRRTNVDSFEDLFGEIESDFSVVLNLDRVTRRIPWELANDGRIFLFEAYDVGRAVLFPNKPVELTVTIKSRKALVVGLDYRWLDEDDILETPTREVELVQKRLQKLGYSVKVLLNEDATLENVQHFLSNGVGVFHFTGHGNYRPEAPQGFRRSLILYGYEDSTGFDVELSEGWLEHCFSEAGRAPWFIFLNACQSAKEIYGSDMIDEFVSYGTSNVIGTSWSVFDKPSKDFVVKFYDQILKTKTIGHALSLTRWNCHQEKRNDMACTWPSYVLYGNPNAWFRRAP